MTKFMELPVEVRALIIDRVIRAEREIVTRFSETNGCRKRSNRTLSRGFGFNISYELDPEVYLTSAYGLLGTSKQINRETSSLLTKIPTFYEVNMAIRQGRTLWPSWTFLSRKTSDIDLLKATIQVGGPRKPCCFHWQSSFVNRQKIVQNILFFFDHYYKFGVRGPPKNAIVIKDYQYLRLVQPSYSVKIIDIDCTEPDKTYEDPVSSDADGKNEEKCDHSTDLWLIHDEKLCAKDLYEHLRFKIYSVIAGLDTGAPSGRPVYSAVGKIKLRLNGELKTEINLTEWLLKFPDQFVMNDESQWRKQAIQYKRDRGFDIPRDVQQFDDPSEFEEELSRQRYGRSESYQ